MIDDADDCGVGRWLTWIEREGGFAALHEEHVLAHAGADRIQRDQRAPGGFTRDGDRLEQEQFDPGKVRVFHGSDDVADDTRELHGGLQSLTWIVSTIPTTAASTGQSFSPDAIRAELPLTISTVSPKPASTVSTATRYVPSTLPWGSTGR